MGIIQRYFFQDVKKNSIENKNDQRITGERMLKEDKNVAPYVTKERAQLNKIQTNQRYDMTTFLR